MVTSLPTPTPVAYSRIEGTEMWRDRMKELHEFARKVLYRLTF